MSLKKEYVVICKIGEFDLKISHPQKSYWLKEGIAKMNVLNYYKRMADTISPQFNNISVTLYYFSKRIESLSFFKGDFKIADDNGKLFRTHAYKEISHDKTIQVPLIDSAVCILWFASK